MQRHDMQADCAHIAENLRRAIELTELALALRQSVLRQVDPSTDAERDVSREIRRAKERAWQRKT